MSALAQAGSGGGMAGAAGQGRACGRAQYRARKGKEKNEFQGRGLERLSRPLLGGR